MKKLLCFFIILISFGFSGNSKKSGIEIYLLKDKFHNPEPKCHYCLDEKKLVLSDKALLEESDIDYFDWKKQQIILSETGKSKISKLEIPLSGIPVIMVLNEKLIYGFWFWNDFSSFGCDRVYTYPKKDFKINFGLPSNNTFGVDPRFNEELKKYILKRFPQHY